MAGLVKRKSGCYPTCATLKIPNSGKPEFCVPIPLS